MSQLNVSIGADLREEDFRPIEASVIILHGEDHFEAGTFCRSSSAKFSRKVKLVVNSSLPKQVQAGHGGRRTVWRDCADNAAKSIALQGILIGVLRLRKPQRRCRITAPMDGRLMMLPE